MKSLRTIAVVISMMFAVVLSYAQVISLTITRSSGTATVSWPVSTNGLALEYNTNLATGIWSKHVGQIQDAVTNMSASYAIQPPTNRFFRLANSSATLSIANVSATEGSVTLGTKELRFVVTRSGDLSGTTTVRFATANGTATGSPSPVYDYVTTLGTLTFQRGETQHVVTVRVLMDFTAEANETFFVNLSVPYNATLTDAQGQGTIVNDD